MEASIGGVSFKPGDYIIMRRFKNNDDEAMEREATDTTKTGKRRQRKRKDNDDSDDYLASLVHAVPYFGQIVYFYESVGERYFHVRWFDHGVETKFRALAGSHQLFATNRCTDESMACISGKIKVDFVKPKNTNSEIVEERFTDVNHFFYRFSYNELSEEYLDAEDYSPDIHQNPFDCQCCIRQREKENESIPRILSTSANGSPRAFKLLGVNYYIRNFVYLVPAEKKAPSDIAQILDMEWSKSGTIIQIRYFYRKFVWFCDRTIVLVLNFLGTVQSI